MRFCLESGCYERVEYGRCSKHERGNERTRRGSASERGYTWKWETRRLAFLAEHPLCGGRHEGAAPVMSQCHDERRVTAATLVDHVEPHRGNEQKFWDEMNWQSMCRDCHDAKTRAGL